MPFQMGNIFGNNLQFCKRAVEMQRLGSRHITFIRKKREIPAQEYLEDDVPFEIGRELIMDIPVKHQGYAGVYINNTTGLRVELPGTRNVD
jgi:hypothetical protein